MTFVSFVFVALCTGIALIKFALPYAPLAWANVGVIRNVNNKPCLQIRLAMLTGKDQLVSLKPKPYITLILTLNIPFTKILILTLIP